MHDSRRLALALLPPLASCADDGRGVVEVVAYGESFIEDGIPETEVADGWSVTFSRFEVGITDVVVAGRSVGVPATVDLAVGSSGAGHLLGSVEVPAGSHSGSSFTLTRVEVDGSATNGAETRTFSWVFDRAVHFDDCESTTVVGDGRTATFQITIHADHLLYDSLVAAEPMVLFQAIADADLDDDGVITQAELAATDIGSYDPGSAGGIDDLWAWLTAQVSTLGHVDGEGHCHATVLD